MKKLFLVAIATVGFTFTGTAQEVTFGVKGGVNNTNFTGDLPSDPKTSFYVGGFVDLGITEAFHIQPELLYSSEGSADDMGVTYLKVPVMLKYYAAPGFNIQAGPYLGFKMATEDDLFDEAIKSMDFGVGVGAGYDLANGLFFDARYNLGLMDISEVDGVEIKNSGIQAGVGYRF